MKSRACKEKYILEKGVPIKKRKKKYTYSQQGRKELYQRPSHALLMKQMYWSHQTMDEKSKKRPARIPKDAYVLFYVRSDNRAIKSEEKSDYNHKRIKWNWFSKIGESKAKKKRKKGTCPFCMYCSLIAEYSSWPAVSRISRRQVSLSTSTCLR